MKKLLKMGLVVPAALALVFSVAVADGNSDLNRDLNEKDQGTSTEEGRVDLVDDQANDTNDTAVTSEDGRRVVDRRGRTPGKTSVTRASEEGKWWWHGGGHGGGGHNDDEDDEDDEDGEGGDTPSDPAA